MKKNKVEQDQNDVGPLEVFEYETIQECEKTPKEEMI